jgi:GT2 family glycosyltransferase
MARRTESSITVVIATRERGDRVVSAVASVRANDYPDWELIVVDQSRDDQTEAALRRWSADARIRYLRSPTRGVSHGRNIGIGQARSELVAITDDDCEVSADWLRELAAAFATDERVGIVFGNVLPGPHDPALGFVPAYVRNAPFHGRGMRDKHRVEGMSACMGLRRTVWHALGGFDPLLGVGAPFESAAESDLTIRALLAGYVVYETPDAAVVHHGFRTWEEGRALIRRYWYGTGAMLAKHLKRGHLSVARLLVQLAWRWAFGRSRVAASLGSDRYRALRLSSFIRGFAAGWRTPVDERAGHFVWRTSFRRPPGGRPT